MISARNSFVIAFILGMYGFFLTGHVSAQSMVGDGALGEAVSIALSPTYPVPGEEVVATVSANKVYTATARVVWSKDGTIVQEKTGDLTYHFTAGPIGSSINLSVAVHPVAGSVLRGSIKQTVGGVRIVWEGKTYTPPFYHGRALMSPGSEVTLQAIPQISNGKGGSIDPKNLVFAWRLNGETNPSIRGLGQDNITAQASNPFGGLMVGVQIEDKQGAVLANGHTMVPVTQPKVLLYTHDPVLGIASLPLGRTHYLSNTEQTVYAEPFYMSIADRYENDVTYEWNIGKQTLNTSGRILLKPEGSGAGTARVDVSITSTTHWQQRTRAEMLVQFDTARGGAGNSETTPL